MFTQLQGFWKSFFVFWVFFVQLWVGFSVVVVFVLLFFCLLV